MNIMYKISVKQKFLTNTLIVLISLFIVFIIIYSNYNKYNNNDNFYTINGFEDKYDFFGDNRKFANYLLYQVHDNLTLLIDYLNKKYKNLNNKRIREGMYRLNNKYKLNKLIENVPSLFNSDTSYTINKGEIIAICLRHKNQNNKFHDLNLITFVAVHELAHIFSIGYGHDDEFWENFKFLLNEAINCKIYDNTNYIEKPIEYCGMMVKYNPLFDINIKNII